MPSNETGILHTIIKIIVCDKPSYCKRYSIIIYSIIFTNAGTLVYKPWDKYCRKWLKNYFGINGGNLGLGQKFSLEIGDK